VPCVLTSCDGVSHVARKVDIMVNSDVLGLAWPEAMAWAWLQRAWAWKKTQARPKPSKWAWLGLGLGLGQGLWLKNVKIV